MRRSTAESSLTGTQLAVLHRVSKRLAGPVHRHVAGSRSDVFFIQKQLVRFGRYVLIARVRFDASVVSADRADDSRVLAVPVDWFVVGSRGFTVSIARWAAVERFPIHGGRATLEVLCADREILREAADDGPDGTSAEEIDALIADLEVSVACTDGDLCVTIARA